MTQVPRHSAATGAQQLNSPSPAVNADVAGGLRRHFRERFGTDARVFRAPGRVNLIGEHTDYNEGFVMPVAIAFSTWVAAAPRRDNELHVLSLNFAEERSFAAGAAAAPVHDWTDYVRGVELALRRAGITVAGADLLIWGDVPSCT